jgi:hypothetical protein
MPVRMVGAAGRQDHQEGLAQRIHFQRARDVDPVAAHRGDAEGGVDQHRPDRADEDDEDARDVRVLQAVERQRHPRQRRDGLQHLDEGIEARYSSGDMPIMKPTGRRHQHGQQEAQRDAAQRIGELDADALVVGPLVVERVRQVGDEGRPTMPGGGKPSPSRRPCPSARVLGVGAGLRVRFLRLRGKVPRADEDREDHQRDAGGLERELVGSRRPQAFLMAKLLT